MKEIRLGKVLGVEIDVTYNWFFIFGLVTVSLTFGVFPAQIPGLAGALYLAMGLTTSLLFFASLLTHEIMHSVVGNRSGIPIKKITLFVFGGMAQMSGEPGDAGSEFRMAVVGPATSAILAGIFFLFARALEGAAAPEMLWWPFVWLSDINFFLAVFNLLPGFPLDGGRIFRSIVWAISGNMETATNIASKTGQVIAFGMMSVGVWLFFLTGNISGLWLVLIGWFLYQAAAGSYQQLIFHHTMQGVRVRDIMSSNVETVSPAYTLRELVDSFFMTYRYSKFPVTKEGAVLGVVTLHDVKEVPEERWALTTIQEILEPLTEAQYVEPDDPATLAFMKMAEHNTGHLLVLKDLRLVGIVTRTDLMRLISIKMELPQPQPA